MDDKHISFWGRTLKDYNSMFNLQDVGTNVSIVSIADGPSTTNKELRDKGYKYQSIDPVYGLTKTEIKNYFFESYKFNRHLFYNNKDKFIFTDDSEIEEILDKRQKTFDVFFEDLCINKESYLHGKLPEVPLSDKSFDLCLCSNFLFLFEDTFDFNFHIQSIREMLRIANEVRLFPLYNREGEISKFLTPMQEYLNEQKIFWQLKDCSYEVYKGRQQFLQIGTVYA
jgi:hypothetical protein